ncbi:MAG: hypothetical protein KKH41_05680 [Candidatus Thermoplasmatota archaeon]|nr:hypothetical protein [Euryarchaeota archaeon]MBU4031263.1 hypothetical protein [Candidatus Thermoplasmatota archaeon]MBU4070727.1 hypothetical protein [Candidatus Thermoplasmatota archaeon]MBU4144966.1 hypothetical protein [Candidatus Thermoplasmatota archaeon]MBU4592058.1 hypothetical protein [Candidatus Thermoplasmatota archaeon]
MLLKIMNVLIISISLAALLLFSQCSMDRGAEFGLRAEANDTYLGFGTGNITFNDTFFMNLNAGDNTSCNMPNGVGNITLMQSLPEGNISVKNDTLVPEDKFLDGGKGFGTAHVSDYQMLAVAIAGSLMLWLPYLEWMHYVNYQPLKRLAFVARAGSLPRGPCT